MSQYKKQVLAERLKNVLEYKHCKQTESVRSSDVLHNIITFFHKAICSGPEYICTCRDQLLYESSVLHCVPEKYNSVDKSIIAVCLNGTKSVADAEWICFTCHTSIKNGKMSVYICAMLCCH